MNGFLLFKGQNILRVIQRDPPSPKSYTWGRSSALIVAEKEMLT
jgi:hypothetical protein